MDKKRTRLLRVIIGEKRIRLRKQKAGADDGAAENEKEAKTDGTDE